MEEILDENFSIEKFMKEVGINVEDQNSKALTDSF